MPYVKENPFQENVFHKRKNCKFTVKLLLDRATLVVLVDQNKQ